MIISFYEAGRNACFLVFPFMCRIHTSIAKKTRGIEKGDVAQDVCTFGSYRGKRITFDK